MADVKPVYVERHRRVRDDEDCLAKDSGDGVTCSRCGKPIEIIDANTNRPAIRL